MGRGFTQEYGLNYHETFSQMARSESWRVLLTIAVNTPGWTVMQWDVKAAYLQANLDPNHEIYVKDLTETGETEYWKLHKALYGLKQAGHQWYNRMQNIMTGVAGLTQCIGDPGCFYQGQPATMVLSTHVDDMAGYGPLEELLASAKKNLRPGFSVWRDALVRVSYIISVMSRLIAPPHTSPTPYILF